MLYKRMGICKKPSLDISEDIVGCNGDYYWLLDGATPPFGELNHQHTRYYVEQMSESLYENADRANSTKELLYCAIKDVKKIFEDKHLNEYVYLPYSTAIIVRVLDDYI